MTSEAERDFLDLIKNGTMDQKRRCLFQTIWDDVLALRAALSNAARLEGEALAEVRQLRAKLAPTTCVDCGESVPVRPRRLCQMCAS